MSHGAAHSDDAADYELVGEELAGIISLLVDTPRAVRIRARRDRSLILFEARVDSDDLGQLIGRQGRTARALRTLLDVRGSQDDRRYGLDIRED